MTLIGYAPTFSADEMNDDLKGFQKLGHTNMLNKKLFNVSWILDVFVIMIVVIVVPQEVKHDPDLEVYTRTIDEIKRLQKQMDLTCHFSFSGGEPNHIQKIYRFRTMRTLKVNIQAYT